MFKRSALSILLILLLVACSDEGGAIVIDPLVMTVTPTPTPTAVPSPSTTPPPPTSAPAITSEPTPIIPAIAAADQPLGDDGRLAIANVTSPQPAWLVIHAQRDGQVSDVLGYTAISPGINNDVTVTIDPLQASPTLVAMLHEDAGEMGAYEFPGPDEPLRLGEVAVSATFAIDIQAILPAITVSDQEVEEDGLIRIENILAPMPGWLLIHAAANSAIGPMLGFVFVQEGSNEDLVVPIQWRQGTPRLYAVLYEDNGRSRRLDYPGDDLPLLISGEPVVVSFNATYPPDVFVLDQPVIDGEFVVERVISNGPGWLVVYFDDEGEVGRIIGSAPLAGGLNERVVVEVLANAVTPQLYILLHEDTEPGDEFDFPRVDPPIMYKNRLPNPFSFRTNSGNYLVTRDQSLAQDVGGTITVTVPLVVTDSNTWVAIHADAGDEPGDILGMALLPPGISRDVQVEINPDQVGDLIHVVLYLDSGTSEQFEFPDGPDVPLQRNRRIIQSPFVLLPRE